MELFWYLNWVLMLNRIVRDTTDSMYKLDLALNNLQRLIYHKTNHPTNKPNLRKKFILRELFSNVFWWKQKYAESFSIELKLCHIKEYIFSNYEIISKICALIFKVDGLKTFQYTLVYRCIYQPPLHNKDMTQGQFLKGFYKF